MNIDGVVYRRLKRAKQLMIPLNLASRRGDSSAVVAQFRKLAKRTARNFRVDSGKAQCCTASCDRNT